MRSPRGTTLVEVLVATVVASLVAASVASLLNMLGGALKEQDVLAEQMVRTAGGQARISDHVLRARAILAVSPSQAALWVPSEDFILSNSFKTAYDEINANEVRWYTWDAAQKKLFVSRTLNYADSTIKPSTTDWAAWYSSLQTANQLETVPILDGLASATFLTTGFNACTTRRLNLDLVFQPQCGGQAIRISEAVQFLQKHKDCP